MSQVFSEPLNSIKQVDLLIERHLRSQDIFDELAGLSIDDSVKRNPRLVLVDQPGDVGELLFNLKLHLLASLTGLVGIDIGVGMLHLDIENTICKIEL